MRERSVGRTRGREPALEQRDPRDVFPRNRFHLLVSHRARSVRGSRPAPAAERQVRVEVAGFERNAVCRDTRGNLSLKRSELLDAGADSSPQDARRASTREHPSTAERDVKGRQVDVLRHRRHQPRHGVRVNRSEKHERQVCLVGSHPLQMRSRRSQRRLDRFCSAAIASRVSGDKSTAANSRTLPALRPLARTRLTQHHQPRHVQCRLRGLELHHFAAADELERANPDLVVHYDG